MTTTPLDVQVAFGLTLDTEIGRWKARQVGEEDWADQPMTLLDAIVDSAADKLADALRRDADQWTLERRNLREKLTNEIDRQLEPIVSEALNGVLQQTDNFGKPTAPPTTLRDMILGQIRKQLTPSNSTSREFHTAFDGAMKQIAADVVTKELRGEIEHAKAEVRRQLGGTLTTAIVERVAAELVK